MTRRTSGQSLTAIVRGLRAKLQGFFGYFKHASVESLREMDGWIRGRLRGILRKRAGLRGRGRGRGHPFGRLRAGRQRWSNRYFADLGLPSLEAARELESISLCKAATY